MEGTVATLEETEVWIRNPKLCIRECVEVHQRNVVWNEGWVRQAGLNWQGYMSSQYGSIPWRVLNTDYEEAREYTSADGLVATWPVWAYGDNPADLEMFVADADTEGGRVIVSEIPRLSTLAGKRFFVTLAELQRDYPDARIHATNLFSFRWAFGTGLFSADVEVRTLAQKGRIALPTGKEVRYEDAPKVWTNLLGYSPKQLEIPRNRCMFNIESARWAGRNYRKNVLVRARGFEKIDPLNPVPNRVKKNILYASAQAEEGDYFFCERCSLSDSCKFYRKGAVCSVAGSEGEKLSKFFKSRDSNEIIEGLGVLLSKQAERYEKGIKEEKEAQCLDPHVTKMFEGLMAGGEKLAKLQNPQLGNGAPPGLPVPTGNAAALANQAVAALEAAGFERSEMTPEMLEEWVARTQGGESNPESKMRKALNP